MPERESYGDFASIVGDAPAWTIGGFALPDGTTWEYREPDAIPVVQNGRLRVAVRELTRRHDRIQILDNAKHMFFSARRFEVPAGGGISIELEMRSRCTGTAPGDLYDGFVSFNLLDLSQGAALDWFAGHDRIAPVYARLPFPGIEAADARPLKYFAIFEEWEHEPGARLRVAIAYDRDAGEARWRLGGAEVWRYRVPVPLSGFVAALGIMTEKDLGPAGSVSCHGQGVIGEWSPLEITTWKEPGDRPANGWGDG